MLLHICSILGGSAENTLGVQSGNHDSQDGHNRVKVNIVYVADIVGEIVNSMREYGNPFVKVFHIQKK